MYAAEEKKDKQTIDKQGIYETSRAPLKAMQNELKGLVDQMMSRWDSDSKDFIKLKKRVNTLKEKIKKTQMDVSNDVFEQINSGGDMGVIGSDGKMRIDLHALHVEEAKRMLHEYVFPSLPVVRKVILVTGRGKNSKGGKSVLKEEIKIFVRASGYVCEDSPNPGILLMSLEIF
jgi:DNA-nicking Smr family endonuclease